MTRTLSDKNVTELSAHLASGKGPEALKLSAPEKKRKRGNEESEIQKACIKWWASVCKGFEVPEELLFSIPNGAVLGHGSVERAIRASILKAEGMRSGVPDLMLAIPRTSEMVADRYYALFIEMKTDNGPVSPVQKLMHKLLAANGYKVVVCRSLSDFKLTVTGYLADL